MRLDIQSNSVITNKMFKNHIFELFIIYNYTHTKWLTDKKLNLLYLLVSYVYAKYSKL